MTHSDLLALYGPLVAQLRELDEMGQIPHEPRIETTAAESARAIKELCAEVAERDRQIVELRADAARYQWIRAREHADIASCWLFPGAATTPSTSQELDAAIDAAIDSAEAK